jgi:hypothetical protein
VLPERPVDEGRAELIASGKDEAVMEMRRSFQDTMRADPVAEVERITNRKVVAFMSSNVLEPDHAIESSPDVTRQLGEARSANGQTMDPSM